MILSCFCEYISVGVLFCFSKTSHKQCLRVCEKRSRQRNLLVQLYLNTQGEFYFDSS